MDWSLKELGQILLHVPGLIVLIAVVVIVILVFFRTPVSDAEAQVNSIADKLASLKEIGDEIIVPVKIEKNVEKYFYELFIENKEVFIKVLIRHDEVLTLSGINQKKDDVKKKVNLNICPKEKDSKKPCVEGEQIVSFSLSFDENTFEDVTTIGQVLLNEKSWITTYSPGSSAALRFYVHDSGRIIMTANY
jgi:hypothetical protein